MIQIRDAILHIYDINTSEPILSQAALDFRDETIIHYVDCKVNQVMQTGKQKNGVIPETAPIYENLQSLARDFQATTRPMTSKFFQILRLNPDIPPADLLWVSLVLNDFPFVGMFKLNHNESFTHFVATDEEVLRNDLIVHRSILPKAKQAIDEGFLYCPTTSEYFLIEKNHLMEETGERMPYLSEVFLGIEANLNMNENIKIIRKGVEKTAKHYNEADYQALAEAKDILYHAVYDDQEFDNRKLADQLYGDNISQKQTYLRETEEMGMIHQQAASPDMLSAKMQRQKLKFDNGIELTIPLELFNDPEVVEIKNNPDGTIGIELKNIESIKNMF